MGERETGLRNHLYNTEWSKMGEWVRGRSTVDASATVSGIKVE